MILFKHCRCSINTEQFKAFNYKHYTNNFGMYEKMKYESSPTNYSLKMHHQETHAPCPPTLVQLFYNSGENKNM